MIKPTIGLKRVGSLEETLRAGNKNVINEPLVPRDRIILPLYIQSWDLSSN